MKLVHEVKMGVDSIDEAALRMREKTRFGVIFFVNVFLSSPSLQVTLLKQTFNSKVVEQSISYPEITEII